MRNYALFLCGIFLLSLVPLVSGCSDEQSKKIQLSAEQGDTDAQYLLGRMYAEGRGVRQDKDQATYWYKKAVEGYRKAAEQGDPEAQFELGLMYANGYGVSKDEIKAFQWLQKAAEQEHGDAQYGLGEMYFKGQGVTKDRSNASEWYQRAEKHGNSDAKTRLQTIADENKTRLSYYEDGKLRSETPYKDGRIHGTVKYYNQHNGNVSQAVQYVDGEKHGLTIVYRDDREVFAEIHYVYGSAKSGVCYREKDYDELTLSEQILKTSYATTTYEKKALTNAQLLNWENGHSLVCR